MTYSLACCHKEYTAVTNTKSSTRVVETCVYPTPMTIVLGAVTETMQLLFISKVMQTPIYLFRSHDKHLSDVWITT